MKFKKLRESLNSSKLNEEVSKIDPNRAIATMNDGTPFNIWTEYESNYDQTDCMKIAYIGKNWMDENDRIIKDNLLGYLEYAYDPYEDPRTAYVKMIEVKNNMKRKGIGTALIQALQKDFGDNINYGYSTPDGTKLLKSMGIMESFKNDSTVFYVGKTEVLKNPSDSEYRQLYNEQRKLHPNTTEPLIRQTYGEFGNYYIWPAYDSAHYNVELYIYKNFGERTNQGKDYELFNHYYLDESLNDNKLGLSKYKIKEILINNPDSYRILYDDRLKQYMIGNAYDIVHRDLITDALKNGYYENQRDFIETFGAIDNYIEIGLDGYYDKELVDEDIVPFLYPLVFIPKGKEEDIDVEVVDDYIELFEYDFGYILSRENDFRETDLYGILGEPKSTRYL